MGKRSRRLRSPKFRKKFASKFANIRNATANIVENVTEIVKDVVEEIVEINTEPPVVELKPEPVKARKPRKQRTRKAAGSKE